MVYCKEFWIGYIREMSDFFGYIRCVYGYKFGYIRLWKFFVIFVEMLGSIFIF